jgi:hypothetical protein
MFCPPFPDEALVFAFCKYLQSEGKLISLAEIMKSHDKLKKLLQPRVLLQVIKVVAL